MLFSQEEWPSWVQEQCTKNGWSHPPSLSPLIWRELIDRGGKGIYMGGVAELEDYAQHYYDTSPNTTNTIESSIATENLDTFQTLHLEAIKNKPPDPIRICISHASSPITYHLTGLILTQDIFQSCKLHLVLYDHTQHVESLKGLAMELQDMACSNLADVTVTDSTHEAFKAISAAFLLDYNEPIEVNNQDDIEGIKKRDLFQAARTYINYAGIMDFSAEKNVRVILIGPYANTGAALMAKTVSSIEKTQFIASPALAERQARSILASKLGVATSDIRQVGMWGSSEGHVVPDTTHTLVHHHQGSIVGPDDFSLPLRQCLFEQKWLKEDFQSLFESRHINSSCYGNQGTYLAKAVVLANLMESWWLGDGAWHSVGVVLEGEELALCYPCCCKDGKWERILNVEIGEEIKEKVEREVERLREEFTKTLLITETHISTNEDTPTVNNN